MKSRLIRLKRTLYGLAGFLISHLPLFIAIISLFCLVIIGFRVRDYLAQAGLGNLDIFTFLQSPGKILETTNARTNILILGIRGEGDDSPDLTDTVLIASYDHANRKFSLISVPRDLWVTSLLTKINSVYHYGRFKDPEGGGIKLVQSAILETLGLPIHYTAVIDFSLFREAIDLVGGIDVEVVTGFTDKQFPIQGKEDAFPQSERYETISFQAGPTHLDGATALKFVRSRHAQGEEGSDIARDRRQQLVISALKQKIITPKFILDRTKTIALYKLLKNNLDTNIDEKLYPSFARLGLDTSGQPIKKIILSYIPDESGLAILEIPPISRLYLNQWVLIAKDNNWPALAQYIQNKL